MKSVILAIRPQPGLAATIAAGARLGLVIEGEPLFEIRDMPWDMPDLSEVDALLLGSANALRHGGEGLAALRDKPAHVVGEATAQQAVKCGYNVVKTGSKRVVGGLQQVLDALAGQRLRLLRLAGSEHVPLTPPTGISITTRIVYESRPVPMPERLAARLREGAIVLLHSAAAARHFAAECDRLGIARDALALAALGPRIAAAAGGGWGEVRSAGTPDDPALLALARDMCH